MKSMKIQSQLDSAKALIEKGKRADAQKILNELLEDIDNNDQSEIYFMLGNIFHLNGEIGKAIKAFNKVLVIEPSHTDAAISLSVLYNDIGHYEEAKKVFEQANERVRAKTSGEKIVDKHISKKFAAKHYELAELYVTYGRFDEALFEYNKASSLDMENLEIRIKIAKVYAKKNFIGKAFEELKKLKIENPNYIQARISLGVLYYGSGKILEAQSEWQQVLSKEPFNKEANMYMNLSKTASETSI